MGLSLVQLQTFMRLSSEGSFTRTAEQLHLTQPAVTQQVRGLQDHFSVKLLDIVGRRSVLTDAGRFLAARAEALLGNVEALERDMREFADVRAGELRVGASITIGTYRLPHIIARFRDAYPGIYVRVEVANTGAIAQSVATGAVSIALVEGPVDDEAFDVEAYDRDELVLIAHPGHELAMRRAGIRFAELAATPQIFREEGSGTRAQVTAAFAHAGITPNVVLALPTGEAIVRAVELGIGVAVVSRLAVADAVAAGRLVRIPFRDVTFERTFRIIRLRRQTPSPAARAFAASVTSSERR